MKKIIFLLSVSLLVFTTCRDKNDDDETPQDNFDRRGLLVNVGNNIIIPAYYDLKVAVDSLQVSVTAFIANPNTVSLDTLQARWFDAYKKWMHASVFEFGPAANVPMRQSVNTFPCDTVQVNFNITNGAWDFNAISNLDAIGFPAFDFLLHNGGDAAVLTSFTSGPNAASRKNYLTDLAANLKSKTSQVYNGWIASGGNYISTFENSTGTDMGSSLGNLVNQLNYDYEILKNARIGIPLGKKSLGVPYPEKCEAVYSSFSLELAIEHVTAIDNIFCGRDKQGNDGPGIDDYLEYRGAKTNGVSLAVAIKTKLDEVKTSLQNISGPLSDAVINNTAAVEACYTKILEGLVLLKTEMPSALGILITYQDADGD